MAALEVNISCPNVKAGGIAFGQDPAMAGKLARRLRIRTDAAQRNISGSRAMWQALQAHAWFYAILTASKPGA